MAKFVLLLVGIALVGMPVGIASIVHSARIKGKLKFALLPFGIAGLILTLVSLFGSISSEDIIVFGYLFLGALVLSITTCLIAVYYRRKANNKIFDDKKKEHEESVLRSTNQATYSDEIKQLKDLLDSGAITQEEYDTKKTEILNRK